ncbi:MAG: hypothetical protein MJE66_01030 [Proteobacteria bacterium]|nr:hypothetical protein [Pseudomonadota bacterium]
MAVPGTDPQHRRSRRTPVANAGKSSGRAFEALAQGLVDEILGVGPVDQAALWVRGGRERPLEVVGYGGRGLRADTVSWLRDRTADGVQEPSRLERLRRGPDGRDYGWLPVRAPAGRPLGWLQFSLVEGVDPARASLDAARARLEPLGPILRLAWVGWREGLLRQRTRAELVRARRRLRRLESQDRGDFEFAGELAGDLPASLDDCFREAARQSTVAPKPRLRRLAGGVVAGSTPRLCGHLARLIDSLADYAADWGTLSFETNARGPYLDLDCWVEGEPPVAACIADWDGLVAGARRAGARLSRTAADDVQTLTLRLRRA